jgi:hypothetical protein
VENGDDVSISVNINFDLTSIHRRLKRVYSVNRLVRRMGLTPAPPGISSLRDWLKEKAAVGADWLLALLRRRPTRPDPAIAAYPVWRPTRR